MTYQKALIGSSQLEAAAGHDNWISLSSYLCILTSNVGTILAEGTQEGLNAKTRRKAAVPTASVIAAASLLTWAWQTNRYTGWRSETSAADRKGHSKNQPPSNHKNKLRTFQ
jgi:hypothetical protein